MIFFDPHGNQIPCQQWLNTYAPSYFRGNPTFGKRFHGAYQVSQYVETKVDEGMRFVRANNCFVAPRADSCHGLEDGRN
jgi:hypothetical protein